MQCIHGCSSFLTSTISLPRPRSSPCFYAVSTPTFIRLFPFLTFRLFCKNISTKESSVSRTIHLRVQCENQLIGQATPRRCFARRPRITSDTATVMFWFAWARVRQRSTLRTERKEASFWRPHFSSHPTWQRPMIFFSFNLF